MSGDEVMYDPAPAARWRSLISLTMVSNQRLKHIADSSRPAHGPVVPFQAASGGSRQDGTRIGEMEQEAISPMECRVLKERFSERSDGFDPTATRAMRSKSTPSYRRPSRANNVDFRQVSTLIFKPMSR
jgi:DNA-directed RNA polymerase beta subunit